MTFQLDPSSPEPLFQQVVHRVKRAVATGRMRPGDRLPSVRDLAKELLVNPNTVAKAYRLLEAAGVTHSRRGAGTFVAPPRAVVGREEALRRLRSRLEPLLADAVHDGLTEEDVRGEFEQAVSRLRFCAERSV